MQWIVWYCDNPYQWIARLNTQKRDKQTPAIQRIMYTWCGIADSEEQAITLAKQKYQTSN